MGGGGGGDGMERGQAAAATVTLKREFGVIGGVTFIVGSVIGKGKFSTITILLACSSLVTFVLLTLRLFHQQMAEFPDTLV